MRKRCLVCGFEHCEENEYNHKPALTYTQEKNYYLNLDIKNAKFCIEHAKEIGHTIMQKAWEKELKRLELKRRVK